MRWFTSDLHLGHANIVRFCDRPFTDVAHMNTAVIDRINALVGPEDELWLLGDIAMGNIGPTLNRTRALTAGRIVLVAGNHDKIHPYACRHNQAKQDAWLARYQAEGRFDDIHLGNLPLTLTDGTAVTVSHFPYPTPAADQRDGSWTDKYAPYRPEDDGSWLLCGHVHEKWQQYDRMINVGIDAWAGLPVSEDQLTGLIAAGPTHRPAARWTR